MVNTDRKRRIVHTLNQFDFRGVAVVEGKLAHNCVGQQNAAVIKMEENAAKGVDATLRRKLNALTGIAQRCK